MEKDETIKELIQFQKNFSLGSVHKEDISSKASHKEKYSLEKDDPVKSLKEFHKSFKLKLDNGAAGTTGQLSTTNIKDVPKTLDIPSPSVTKTRRKKKRRRRSNETVVKFTDIYQLSDEILGSGARSTVVTCIKRQSGSEYAVKVVQKTSPEVRDRVLKEVEILHTCVAHKNFLQIEDFFESDENFHLVFEKMAGPLLAFIQKRERFTEREASLVTKEVASALSFLHEQGIAHRDLKPENILCERDDQVVPIKICDFDLSSIITHPTPTTTPNLFTPVGSAEFMAPEVVDTFRGEIFSYDKKCDLWSLGVLVFMMLSGSPPFYGRCLRDCGWERGENCEECQDMLLQRIKKGHYSFPPEVWSNISSEAQDLISKLLELNVEKRLSAKEVLKHPWLIEKDVPDTPLKTPGVLRRNPSIPEELSHYAASCLKCTRKMSAKFEEKAHYRQPFTLSPPGSSELALRREHKITPPQS